jgi:MipA family protein
MGVPANRITHDPLHALLFLAAFLAGAIVPARGNGSAAEDACAAPSSDCLAEQRWNFSLALGAGVRTNPLVSGEDIPLVLVPHVSYYGKRFFLDDLDLGFTLAESNSNTLSLIASPDYDRVYFYRTDLQNFFITGYAPTGSALYTAATTELRDSGNAGQEFTQRPRRVTYLAGPEWTFKYEGITGQLDFLHEITGADHGNEIRAALGMPLLKAKGTLSANVGITWNDAAIIDYFYGEPGIYRPGAALNPFAKLAYTVPLSSKWRLDAFTEYEHLGSAIVSSPIIDKHSVTTVFVGAVYAF